MATMEVFDIMEKLRIKELELYEIYKTTKLVFGENSEACARAISRWHAIYDFYKELQNEQEK
jgi:hypothetical protein